MWREGIKIYTIFIYIIKINAEIKNEKYTRKNVVVLDPTP